MSEILPFPTQPLPDESNEAFAERKRQWARENSERIREQKWLDYSYLPEDKESQLMEIAKVVDSVGFGHTVEDGPATEFIRNMLEDKNESLGNG